MTEVDAYLDRIAPGDGWVGAWDEVLRRAADPRDRRTRRRFAIALAVLLIVAVPLVAVAATNDWWFLRHGGSDVRPTRGPYVVKTGTWSGRRWELIAYPNATNGLCFGITPLSSQATGAGGELACAPFAGFARTTSGPDLTITYAMTSRTRELPAHVSGPVVGTAATVAVRLGDTTVRVPTIAAPKGLGNVRFYAAQVPSRVFPAGQRGPFVPPISSVAGYDKDGHIVACLNPRTAREGVSPRSACG